MLRAVVIAFGLAFACRPADAAINQPAPILKGTTGTIGGSSVGAGSCTTGTATVTGVTTSMVVDADPTTFPGTAFVWSAYVSAANTVTVRVCVVSGIAATPTATTYNIRAIP